jgi:membrane protein
MYAAGVAFYFLLGLIPFLFITVAVTGYVFRDRPEALANLSVTIMEFLPPGLGQGIMDQITGAVASWETFGALGVISLIFISMGLFEAIDWGINGAMGTRKKVGFLTGRLIVLAYITGAMIFFTLAAVADYAFHLILATPTLEEFSRSVYIPRRLFSLGAFTVFMFILYWTIPVKAPKWYRAAFVALAVSAAWTLLQKLGANITVAVTRRSAIYGALTAGALFLSWMYFFSLLTLLGATILDSWDRLRPKPRERLAAAGADPEPPPPGTEPSPGKEDRPGERHPPAKEDPPDA